MNEYTTADYLNQLEQDRQDLVDNLETQGISGLSGDETFTELVPEVLNISGSSIPTSFADFDAQEITNTDGLLNYWNNSPSLRTAIESGNTTLYTPSSQCPIYYIYIYNDKYYVWWLPYKCYTQQTNYWYATYINLYANTIINYGENGWYTNSYQSFKLNEDTQILTYYVSNIGYDTIDDLINGMKNNTVEYTESSARRWYATPVISNAILGSKNVNPKGDIYNDAQIISHNETIITMS